MWSPSARLDLISSTRTNPFVDGILLMGESLIIGNNMANHVVYHGEEHQIVLFQQDGQLCYRSDCSRTRRSSGTNRRTVLQFSDTCDRISLSLKTRGSSTSHLVNP